VRARTLDRSEAIGEGGAILERLEVRLGIRIVIGDVGATVGLGDIQIDWQCSHRPRISVRERSSIHLQQMSCRSVTTSPIGIGGFACRHAASF